jgi:DNA polymerase-3 subunit delta
MIYSLTGENSFALFQKLRLLVEDFLSEYDEFGLERVDGEEAEFSRIQESLTSLPFLASKKMIILKSPSKNKQFIEQFEQLLGGIPETTDVVLVEQKLDKRLSYYKFLKNKTDFQEFNELDQPHLVRWLSMTAKDRGGSINDVDARYLVDRVGAHQQLLANELEKLLLYDSNVTRPSINLLTEEAPQSTIFQLLESAFTGDAKQTIKLYKEQRQLKIEPQQIIAMLTWQLHILAVIKTASDRSADQIAADAKINPYVVRKSLSIARRISLAELKGLITDLLEIDTRLKRESLDADGILQNYLIQIASK